MYKTTTDLLTAAIQLKEVAEHVTNREQHAAWWDSKTDVYIEVYNALESGAFTGEARDELKQAQYVINEAEMYAAVYALNEKAMNEEVKPQRLSLGEWETIFTNLQESGEYVEVTWLDAVKSAGEVEEWVLHCDYELFEDGFKTEEEAMKRLDTLERHFAQYIN